MQFTFALSPYSGIIFPRILSVLNRPFLLFFSCNTHIVLPVLYELFVTFVRMSESLRETMETLFNIYYSSIVSLNAWMLFTPYIPKGRKDKKLNQQLPILSLGLGTISICRGKSTFIESLLWLKFPVVYFCEVSFLTLLGGHQSGVRLQPWSRQFAIKFKSPMSRSSIYVHVACRSAVRTIGAGNVCCPGSVILKWGVPVPSGVSFYTSMRVAEHMWPSISEVQNLNDITLGHICGNITRLADSSVMTVCRRQLLQP